METLAEATGLSNWYDQEKYMETFHTIQAMQNLQQHLEFQAENLKQYILEDVSRTNESENLQKIINNVHRCVYQKDYSKKRDKDKPLSWTAPNKTLKKQDLSGWSVETFNAYQNRKTQDLAQKKRVPIENAKKLIPNKNADKKHQQNGRGRGNGKGKRGRGRGKKNKKKRNSWKNKLNDTIPPQANHTKTFEPYKKEKPRQS